jgi:hypothetical protein
MIKKSPVEMERWKLTKATRTLVRLKHSLAADEELNDILPDKLAEFDINLQRGAIKQINIGLALTED